ncbi:MAG: electron transport complex subunit RsxB [Burkholderiaceae bacterium]|nr:electron transport complex subunit RsxB [Burkholderiaceae bacterium]
MSSLADRIDALLPQTQCTKCGFDGCRPYAEAMASADAQINQCPPGGAAGIGKLAALLDRPPLPLNPAHGIEQPLRVAVIDESLCIGCTLCIQACPVDAIVGATRRMHTVLPAHCTGCDLCVAPCPMDCIAMLPVSPSRSWSEADADVARARYLARNARLAREKLDNEQRLAAKAIAKLDEIAARDDLTAAGKARKQSVVQAAIERARARRASSTAVAATATCTATDAAIGTAPGNATVRADE